MYAVIYLNKCVKNKSTCVLNDTSLSPVQKGVLNSGAKSLIAFQAIYRVIEMTGKRFKNKL